MPPPKLPAALRGLQRLRKLLPSYYLERTRDHLRRFRPLPDIGLFEESRPLARAPGQAYDHAALLLHGFSSSTQTFERLSPELEARGVASYAPLLTGFGLDSMRLLGQVEASDWRRDALTAFDLLGAFARRVSVVGVSTGATLGAWVAQQRKVEHLVLIAPNFKLTEADLRYRRLLEHPWLSRAFLAAKPYFEKPVRPGRLTNRDVLCPHMAEHHLDYPALPTRSVRAIFGVQDRIDLRAMRFGRLTVIAGAHDQTVDVSHALEALASQRVRHDRLEMARSAHNVLIDVEREEAARLIAELLASPP